MDRARATKAERFRGKWNTQRLGDLGTFTKGRGIKRDDLGDAGVRCVRYGELYTLYKNYVTKPVSWIPQTIADTALPIKKGDLLFAGSGETADEIGTCVAYVGDESAYAGGDIIVLKESGQDAIYLAHLVNDPIAARQRARMAQGHAVVHIRAGHLAQIELRLPPLPEQRAIAAVLSDVDELIGSLEALTAKKRAIKQAAMQELLTGTTRLPGFGGEWEMRRLGNLGTFSKGRGIKRTDLRKTGVGCVRYGELYTRYENYVSKPASKVPQDIADIALPIRRGDLMFAASGETADEIGICVAYVGSEPAYAGGDIIVLRASGQDAVYLAHLLNAPVAARQKTRMAQGDAVVHIRADHLAAIEIPLPPLPEQRAIATTLSDMDSEIAALDHRLDKTRAIKQGMMQQLLTGSIRLPIPDDDTDDDDAHDA